MKKRLLPLLLFTVIACNLWSQTYHELDKEGLRVILSKKGTAYLTGHPNHPTENVDNYTLFGLDENDIAGWETSEDWIQKLEESNYIELTWNEENPRRITRLSLKRGVSDTDFDLSYFSELEYIRCSISRYLGSAFEAVLDISSNKKLKTIDGYKVSFKNGVHLDNIIEDLLLGDHGSFFYLPLINLPKLKKVRMIDVSIPNPDFSHNPLLEELYLGTYIINGLNLTSNSNLRELTISASSNAYLGELDLSGCINLEELRLTTIVDMESLDLSNNINLKNVWISYCFGLKDIIWGNVNPERISITAQILTEKFDISHMTNLRYFDWDKWVFYAFSELPLVEFEELNTRLWDNYRDVSVGEVLDFSSEYIIDGYYTDFKFYDGSKRLSLEGDNGVFVVPANYGLEGRTIECRITNERFPGLTLTYTIYVKGAAGVEENMSQQVIRLESANINRGDNIVLLSEGIASGKAALYNTSGALLSDTDICSNRTEITSPYYPGIYIIRVIKNNRSLRSMKLIVR